MKILGHPAHPMFVVYPLGLFTVAILFDILYLWLGIPVLPTVSFYMIAAGIVGGLVAAVFGFVDWLGLPKGSRARRIGGWHGLGNFTLVVLFAISWFLRLGAPNYVPGTLALIPSFGAAILSLVTAWLGGEMVYRMSVGVDPGANENAPSSLSGEPAGRSQKMRQTTH